MQTYGCKACGFQSRRGGEEEQRFDTFLHIFTTHLHKDIGLEREESAGLMNKTRLHRLDKTRLWAISQGVN